MGSREKNHDLHRLIPLQGLWLPETNGDSRSSSPMDSSSGAPSSARKSSKEGVYGEPSRRDKPRSHHHGLTQQKRQEIKEAFELFDTDGFVMVVYLRLSQKWVEKRPPERATTSYD